MLAAIHGERGAGDEAGVLTRQERDALACSSAWLEPCDHGIPAIMLSSTTSPATSAGPISNVHLAGAMQLFDAALGAFQGQRLG